MNNSNMPSLPPSQVSDDFAAFQQTTPQDASFAKKLREQQEKDAKKAEAALKPKQLEMAQKLIDLGKEQKEEETADLKAPLIRKINAYLKRYPDRLEHVKIPKTFGVKNTVDELKVFVKDIEHELGKKSGFEIARFAYVEGMKFLESTSATYNPFNLNLTNLGKLAEANTAVIVNKDGSRQEGPIAPVLEEFTIKHDNWFSTSVEVRLVITTMELVMACHRMNSPEVQATVKTAQTTPASTTAKNAAKNL